MVSLTTETSDEFLDACTKSVEFMARVARLDSSAFSCYLASFFSMGFMRKLFFANLDLTRP